MPIGCQSWTDQPPSSGDWSHRLRVTNSAGSAISASVAASTARVDPSATATVEDSAMGQRLVVNGSAADDQLVITGDTGSLTVDSDLQ